jgi:hypothetical protein
MFLIASSLDKHLSQQYLGNAVASVWNVLNERCGGITTQRLEHEKVETRDQRVDAVSS